MGARRVSTWVLAGPFVKMGGNSVKSRKTVTRTLLGASAIGLFGVMSAAQAQDIYRWVDKDGIVRRAPL